MKRQKRNVGPAVGFAPLLEDRIRQNGFSKEKADGAATGKSDTAAGDILGATSRKIPIAGTGMVESAATSAAVRVPLLSRIPADLNPSVDTDSKGADGDLKSGINPVKLSNDSSTRENAEAPDISGTLKTPKTVATSPGTGPVEPATPVAEEKVATDESTLGNNNEIKGGAPPPTVATSPESAPLTVAALRIRMESLAATNRAEIRTQPDPATESLNNRITSQVSRHLSGELRQLADVGVMKLSLTPPHLGKVEILFSTRGDGLQVMFKVESTEAQEALRNSASDLGQLILSRDQSWKDVNIQVSRQQNDQRKQEDSATDRRGAKDPEDSGHASGDEQQEGGRR